MKLESNSIVAPAQQQVSCSIGDEIVILNASDGVYYGLEGVGARVWELLNERRTVGAIRDQIIEEYEVDPERCEADLIDLLHRLQSVGIISEDRAAT